MSLLYYMISKAEKSFNINKKCCLCPINLVLKFLFKELLEVLRQDLKNLKKVFIYFEGISSFANRVIDDGH